MWFSCMLNLFVISKSLVLVRYFMQKLDISVCALLQLKIKVKLSLVVILVGLVFWQILDIISFLNSTKIIRRHMKTLTKCCQAKVKSIRRGWKNKHKTVIQNLFYGVYIISILWAIELIHQPTHPTTPGK